MARRYKRDGRGRFAGGGGGSSLSRSASPKRQTRVPASRRPAERKSLGKRALTVARNNPKLVGAVVMGGASLAITAHSAHAQSSVTRAGAHARSRAQEAGYSRAKTRVFVKYAKGVESANLAARARKISKSQYMARRKKISDDALLASIRLARAGKR